MPDNDFTPALAEGLAAARRQRTVAATSGWRAIRERAKTIYWGRRKDGATENEALYSVLDDCLRDDATG